VHIFLVEASSRLGSDETSLEVMVSIIHASAHWHERIAVEECVSVGRR